MSNNTKNNRQNLDIPDDVVQLASAVFGSAVKVELWLSTPIRALGGDTPVKRLKTNDGADEVRTILHKIEKGEFS